MTTPPTDDAAAWSRLAALARETVKVQLRLARQTAELGRATLAGDVDRATAGRAYLEAVSREGEQYWRALTDLGVGYLGEAVALGGRLTHAVLRDLTPPAGSDAAKPRPFTNPSAASGAEPRPFTNPSRSATDAEPRPFTNPSRAEARVIPVAMAGTLGEVAVASVVVENHHPRRRRVVVTPGPVTSRSGRDVGATVQVDPAQVTLAPGAERTLSLRVELDALRFSAGRTYRGQVQVSGGDEAVFDVTITVRS